MAQWGNSDDAANSVNWAVSQVNKSISTENQTNLFGNVTTSAFITNAKVGQFGVDTTEQAASEGAITHAGWILRTEGTGGRAGRVTYETLVAMSSIGDSGTADATDDTQIPDYKITIRTQPSSNTATTGSAVNLTVVPYTVPAGGTLTYSWEVNTDGTAWADVANTGVYATANGNTSATLSITDNTGLDGYTYRVLISVDGGADVYSANAIVTEA
jgi:hypothetical protein